MTGRLLQALAARQASKTEDVQLNVCVCVDYATAFYSHILQVIVECFGLFFDIYKFCDELEYILYVTLNRSTLAA